MGPAADGQGRRGRRHHDDVYTQTNGLTTKKEETEPLGSTWKTTTEYAPAWGPPTAQVDPNGKRGDMDYDPLGRLVSVWLPDRPRRTA